MSIRILTNGLTFEINRLWVQWYVGKVTRNKKSVNQWLECASESDIQKLINMAIEYNKIICCEGS